MKFTLKVKFTLEEYSPQLSGINYGIWLQDTHLKINYVDEEMRMK